MGGRVWRWSIGCFIWVAACMPGAVEAGVLDPEVSEIEGTVTDKSGAALAGARVVVMTPQRTVVATTTTDAAGKFALSGLPPGPYIVTAAYPSFGDRQATVTLTDATKSSLALQLDTITLGATVVVTATPGEATDAARLTQPVNVIDGDTIRQRAATVVAQAVNGETAVNLQRTSPGMAGIFVRGLTGNKVNVFIDGVRYSNGAQRGGVNTFLDLIDASTLDSIEILRGTSSAQYGSDALGGSVQFLTEVPTFAMPGRPAFSGTAMGGFETGHYGGVGALTVGYARSGVGLTGSFSGRKTGDYRPGDSLDSHASVTRYFGLPSDRFYGTRMADTGFHQMATQLRSAWAPRANWLVTANYLRTRQDGANRWDQTLGGDGNLIAELNDLQLDLAYVRVEGLSAGWFDRASATYSFNTQREERVNQGGNGNPNALIAHEPERTTVNGLQANASRRLSERTDFLVGGDAYFEGLTSDSYDVNPVTGAQTVRRPRVPSGATYRQGGVFAQSTFTPRADLTVIGALRAGYATYAAHASDAPLVNGVPLWPDDSLDTGSVTFRAGAAYAPKPAWSFNAAVSRGYRAPHMTDLGTLGLTGSGFEVSAPEVAGRSAFVGTTSDAAARSTGRPVEQVTSETSLNVDFGARYRTSRARLETGFFVNWIHGNIQKPALILPPGAVGSTIGGQTIVAQTADGAVFVPVTTVPVLVRANFDEARVWGYELNAEFNVASSTTVGGTYTYLRTIDTASGASPNIEGGTPAPGGWVWARLQKSGQPWWVQPYLFFAGEQTHLSSLDLGDRRTGATRSRANIQNFFRNGARARGWINAGGDGVFGNGDDFLIDTGETLVQIQDRVLGPGVNSAPMFTAVKGYAMFGVRTGATFGRHAVTLDIENIGDSNYRGISWGMDAPGFGMNLRYRVTF